MEIDYDPAIVSYDELLDVFWGSHDPTRGAYSVQYRAAVFFRTDQEREAAERTSAALAASLGPVQTAIEPLQRFYRAEDYHQKYWLRSERVLMSDFREMFADDRAFVDSTAAARVNGWLHGCGSAEQVERETPLLGLSERALETLRMHTVATRRAASCG